jgi:hypothetical protein
MTDMPRRTLFHAAVYFTGPLYNRVMLLLDYSISRIPEEILLQSLRQEEQERNPLASYLVLETRKRQLTANPTKHGSEDKRPKLSIIDKQKAPFYVPQDAEEPVISFWTEFCRGDFRSPYTLQDAMKRIGEYELQKLSPKRMYMLLRTFNQSLGPGPVLITAQDLPLAVKQAANSSVGIHETLAFRNKFKDCQFDWDCELLGPSDLGRLLVKNRQGGYTDSKGDVESKFDLDDTKNC